MKTKTKRTNNRINFNADSSTEDTETDSMSVISSSGRFNPLAKRQPLPLHQRKYTPHSYFASTLRDVVAGPDSVVVIIPQQETEIQLRKRMFKIFKDKNIHDTKEYEYHLRELVKSDALIKDEPFTDAIGKRYVYLVPGKASDNTSTITTTASALITNKSNAASVKKPRKKQAKQDKNSGDAINESNSIAASNAVSSSSPSSKPS